LIQAIRSAINDLNIPDIRPAESFSMNNPEVKDKPVTITLRWIARIWSILVIAVLLIMFLGEGISLSEITPGDWLILLFFPFGILVGMILAWWKEGLGGLIILIGLLGFIIFGNLAPDAYLPSLIFAGPGFLFLLTWFLSRRTKTTGTKAGVE
jgi:hypothetical protein